MDLTSLLDKAEHAPEVTAFLASIGPTSTVDAPPFRRYIGSPENGIDLLFDEDVLVSIQIFVQKSEEFSAYRGELPLGLSGVATRADAEKILGKAGKSSEISAIYKINDHLILIFSFDDASHIRFINIESGPP